MEKINGPNKTGKTTETSAKPKNLEIRIRMKFIAKTVAYRWPTVAAKTESLTEKIVEWRWLWLEKGQRISLVDDGGSLNGKILKSEEYLEWGSLWQQRGT